MFRDEFSAVEALLKKLVVKNRVKTAYILLISRSSEKISI